MAAVLEIRGLEFGYNGRPLFGGLDLVIRPGELVVVTGRNGAGKSTLLKLVLGLLRPWRGEVRLFGQELRRFRQWRLLGYLPQGTEGTFYRSFPATVAEVVGANLALPHHRRLWPSAVAKERVRQSLAAVELEALAGRPVDALSGGQQRRVLLARALVNGPRLLVLDEPLAGIDREAAEKIVALLLRLKRETGMAVLLASHDHGGLEAAATRIIRLGGPAGTVSAEDCGCEFAVSP